MNTLDSLQSPESPELNLQDLTNLAGFAKHLGKAPLRLHHRPQNGTHLTRVKGHGMEMLEVRQYHQSDELRHIDWRISARTGKTHTRVYAEEKEHSRLLVLHLSGNAYFGTQDTFISTRMVQLQSLIAWRTKQQNDKIGAYLQFGNEQHFLPINNKGSNVHTLLSHLAKATQVSHRHTNNSALSPWFALQQKKIKHKQIIICSDAIQLSNIALTQLHSLSRYNKIHWVSIQDGRLADLPEGKYQFENVQGKHIFYASKSVIEKGVTAKHMLNSRLEQQLNQIGVLYHRFDLHESPVQMARHLLFCGALS